jgi:hypothetical protein
MRSEMELPERFEKEDPFVQKYEYELCENGIHKTENRHRSRTRLNAIQPGIVKTRTQNSSRPVDIRTWTP